MLAVRSQVNIRTSLLRALAVFSSVSGIVSGCSEYHDIGQYRVADVSDGFFGMVCQTRQELYFVPSKSKESPPVFLGACFTPGYVTDQLRMPSEASCFAFSPGGQSAIYLHLPYVCGAGDAAKRKPGGVYRHDPSKGDQLLYPERSINQVWGGTYPGAGAIRVSWRAPTPSASGARCPQTLVIYADGREVTEGEPNPQAIECKAWHQ